MSLITRLLVDTQIDFPHKDARLAIEDNIGDEKPIHIHFGRHEDGKTDWHIRLHFTYQEFQQMVEAMKRIGRI